MPLEESAEGRRLIFRQPLSAVTRLILGAGGVLALSAPHELLIKPGVPLFQLGMVPFWILGILAGLLGALFLLAAILGLTRSVIFDADAREMLVDGNGSFGIGWRTRHRFADILELSVIEDATSDGPSRFLLQAVVANAKGPAEIENFEREHEALIAKATIEAMMLGDDDPV